MPEQLTDEERLQQFSNSLDSFKPEGFDDDSFNKLKEAVVKFHADDVKGLKINTAKAIQEKDDIAAKYQTAQTTLATNATQIEELNKQLQANQPEQQKQFFENQISQMKGVYEKQLLDANNSIKKLEADKAILEKGVLERDVMADFNKAASNKNWLEGGREAAQKIALAGIEFTRLDMRDGTVALVDKNTSKDVNTILNDFLGTEFGKSFLRSGTSGGGADGSAASSGSGKKLTEAQFNALNPDEQMNAVLEGRY